MNTAPKTQAWFDDLNNLTIEELDSFISAASAVRNEKIIAAKKLELEAKAEEARIKREQERKQKQAARIEKQIAKLQKKLDAQNEKSKDKTNSVIAEPVTA